MPTHGAAHIGVTLLLGCAAVSAGSPKGMHTQATRRPHDDALDSYWATVSDTVTQTAMRALAGHACGSPYRVRANLKPELIHLSLAIHVWPGRSWHMPDNSMPSRAKSALVGPRLPKRIQVGLRV